MRCSITVPSLRQRVANLPLLVVPLLDRLARPDEPRPRFSAGTWEALMHYPFPGNIRELENTLAHALVLARRGRAILPVACPGDRGARPEPERAGPGGPELPVPGGGAFERALWAGL